MHFDKQVIFILNNNNNKYLKTSKPQLPKKDPDIPQQLQVKQDFSALAMLHKIVRKRKKLRRNGLIKFLSNSSFDFMKEND